jgi:putative Ca2+/H+ antiporter (TMEM165/GDT1 family)
VVLVIIDFLNAMFTAFGVIFIAELGDKTQLIILTLATQKHAPKKLAIGATMGFAIIVFLGGFISTILTQLIDLNILVIIAAFIFIAIGGVQLITLIRHAVKKKGIMNNTTDNDEIDTSRIESKTKNTFLMGFLAIIMMEMGDKTQLMTVLLASTSSSFFGTLIGSWLALSILAIIGAFMGEFVAKKVPKYIIEWVSAFLFTIIGVLMAL